MKEEGIYGQAVSGIRWMGLSKVIAQAVAWLFTIFIIRLLSPEDYGIMSMAGLVTILAGMLLDAGLGAAFIQRRDIPDAVICSANAALLLSAAVAIGIVQISAGAIAHFFSEPRLASVLRVISLQFLLSALIVVPNSMLTAKMRFRELAVTQTAFSIVQSVATIVLALLKMGVWSLILGTLIGSTVRLALLHLYARPPTRLSSNFALLRPYAAFSGYLVVQRLAWFWVEQADQFIIGRMLGAAPLGAFSVAKNLAQMPLDRTGEIVNQVSLPSFASVQDDMIRWQSGFTKLLRLASALAFPIFWGMAAVAPVALPLVLGDKWGDAIQPFALICLVLPLRMAHSLATTALLAIGRADISLKIVIAWALVLSPLFIVGAHYGLLGVAAAWTFGFPVVYLICMFIVSRRLKLPILLMLSPMTMPAVAGAGCALAAGGIDLILDGKLPQLWILLIQISAGATVYIVALRLLASNLCQELIDLFSRLAGRRKKQ